MVNILREDGSAGMTGSTLRIHKNGQATETVLDTEEKLREVLLEKFGIAVDFPLKI